MAAFAAITVHRWNLRQAALTAAILAFLTDFCTAFLQSAMLIILTRIISGLSMGVLLSTASAAIARLVNPTRTLGIAQAAVSISGFGWFLIMPYLLKNTGLKGPFIGIAAFSLIAFVVTLAWFPRLKGQNDVATGQRGLFHMLTTPVLFASSGLFILLVAGNGVWTYWERIGVHSGLSAEGIGTSFALGSISGMFGGLLAAWIAGKIGNATALITGTLVMLVSAVLLLFYNPTGYFAATLIFYASWILVVSFFLGGFAEADSTGRLVAVANIVMFAAAAIGPAAASLLLAPSNYHSLIIICACAMLASLILIIPAVRRKDWLPVESEPAV